MRYRGHVKGGACTQAALARPADALHGAGASALRGQIDLVQLRAREARLGTAAHAPAAESCLAAAPLGTRDPSGAEPVRQSRDGGWLADRAALSLLAVKRACGYEPVAQSGLAAPPAAVGAEAVLRFAAERHGRFGCDGVAADEALELLLLLHRVRRRARRCTGAR